MTIDIFGTLGYAIYTLALPFVFTVSFVVFVWGAFQYFVAGGHDEEAREKGKSLMMYGFIVFAIDIIVWCALRIVTNLFS